MHMHLKRQKLNSVHDCRQAACSTLRVRTLVRHHRESPSSRHKDNGERQGEAEGVLQHRDQPRDRTGLTVLRAQCAE